MPVPNSLSSHRPLTLISASELRSMLSRGDLFFKYRAFNEATKPHIRDVLIGNRVYFARRSSFNDPFDSCVRPVYEGTEDEWRDRYAGVLARRCPELSEEQRLKMVRDMIRNQRFKSIPDWVGRDFPERAGIFCLSKRYDHLLMWSHYAESHTGLCIAFSEDNAFFGSAQPITYVKAYPDISYLHSSQDVLTTAMLLTKADVWEYEEEWRIIEHKGGPGIYTFPPESLVAVILGCKMPAQNKDLVQQWCSERRPRPRIFQACMSERQFALDFKEITSIAQV